MHIFMLLNKSHYKTDSIPMFLFEIWKSKRQLKNIYFFFAVVVDNEKIKIYYKKRKNYAI